MARFIPGLAIAFHIVVIGIIADPAFAHAADMPIKNIILYDEQGEVIPGFSYSPAAEPASYSLVIDDYFTVTVAVSADPDIYLATNLGFSGKGELTFEKSLEHDLTYIYIMAVAGEIHTVELAFRVVKDTSGTDDNDDSDSGGSDSGDSDNAGSDPSVPEIDTEDGSMPENGDDTMLPAEDDPEKPPMKVWTNHIALQIGSAAALHNDTGLPLDAAPYLVSPGYTFVPLRFIAEAMGAAVFWRADERKIEIFMGDVLLHLYVDVLLPDMPVSAQIRNGRTFVPLRYVAENLGAAVEWVPEGQYVHIYY